MDNYLDRHIIEVRQPHILIVRVGLRARSAELALQAASAHLAEGGLFDDTPSAPLLAHDFIPASKSASSLSYLGSCQVWPRPDGNIEQMRSERLAQKVCLKLIDAMQGPDGLDKPVSRRTLYEALGLAIEATRSARGDGHAVAK